MATALVLMESIKAYGVGRRKLDDDIFLNDKPPPRLGVYDIDDESLSHDVFKATCNILGCHFTAESLLAFEDHYNSSHRYTCAQCKKMLPSPHLLDLHLQETHDSFFAVMAEKKPSFCCYIEECKEKFTNANERHEHCVEVHKLPKDFRFEERGKNKNRNKNKNKITKASVTSMDLDADDGMLDNNRILLFNNKQKTFPKYSGRKFTKNKEDKPKKDADMDITVNELKESLPQ